MTDPHRSLPAATLAGRRVLVAGGSGFIGSHLVRRLRDSGATVHAVSRRARPAGEAEDPVVWHTGDLADPEFARALGDEARPELLFHLAGHVDGSRDLGQVLPTLRGNLLTTVNLLLLAERADAERVVLAGSMDEPWSSDRPCSPPDVGVPPSPYAAAKWSASAYGLMFDRLYSTSVVVARLYMVYGPGQKDPEKLLPYTIRSLLRGSSPKLTAGDRKVDWVFVEDAVEALLLAAVRPEAAGRVIDIGSGERTSVRSVVEEISTLIGGDARPEFGRIEERPFETEKAADLTIAESALGWSPRVGLTEGLTRTVEWYRES